MSTERRKPLKRDQALNDATAGQFGEEPRPSPKPNPDFKPEQHPSDNNRNPRVEAARKRSRYV